MKKQNEQRLVPKLRFKGFSEDWEQCKLKDITKMVSEKNTNNYYQNVFTNSALQGIVNQSDYFDKDIANSNNLSSYYVVQKDHFIYNPRISKNAPYGPINRNKLNQIGVMSPLYLVFENKQANHDFLECYFLSSKWYKYMLSVGNTGARSDRYAIKNKDFFNMPIHLPVYDEQYKIGKILKVLNHTINLHKRKLLIYKRLLEYYSSLFYSTEKGIIFSNSKDSWKKEKLNKVFYPHKLSDVIFSEEDKDLTGDKLHIITQGDTPIKEIIEGTGNQDYEEVIFFGDHTLSLSKINGPYKVDTDGVKVLHVDKHFDRDFIFYLIKCNMPASEGYKRHFTILKNKKVWLTTDINEQVKISNTLNLLDKLVNSQNNKIEQLQNLRAEYLNTLFI